MARADAEGCPGIFDIGLFDGAGIGAGDVLGDNDVAAEDICCDCFFGTCGICLYGVVETVD